LHAGLGLFRPGADAGGLCPRHRPGLPLLFLWRCLPADARGPAVTAFGFELLASDGAARRGRLTTAHGTAETPAFMTVGTAGTVKGLTPDEVKATGAEIVLGNTYHLMLRPGDERIGRLGGLHD